MKNRIIIICLIGFVISLGCWQYIYSYAADRELSEEQVGEVNEISVRGSKYEYKVVELESVSKMVGFFPEGVPEEGRRLKTDELFWYSRTGGKNITRSVSVNLPVPFNIISFSIDTGKVVYMGKFEDVEKDLSFGMGIAATNTTDFLRLYVEREINISPYKIMRRKSGADNTDWEFFSSGFKQETWSASFDTKKV